MAENDTAPVASEDQATAQPDAALAALTAEIAEAFEALIVTASRLRGALSPLVKAAAAEGAATEAVEQATALKQARQRISAASQTGDAAAQRLEHIAVGIALAREHEDETRIAAAAVLAAQVEAMAEVILDETVIIDEAAGAVAAQAKDLAALLQTEAGEALATTLAALEQDVTDRLRAASAALSGLAPALGAVVADGAAAPGAPRAAPPLDWLDALYTMDAERQVHNEALERLAGEGTPADDAAAAPPAGAAPMPPSDALAPVAAAMRARLAALIGAAPAVETAMGFRLAFALPMAAITVAAMVTVAGAAAPVQVAQALLGALAACAIAWAVLLSDRVRQRTEARLTAFERMALRDPLTDLLNRRGLTDRLAEALAPVADPAGGEARAPAAALHIDLDHFKAVNDTLGHDAGDHVLVVAAERMRTVLAENLGADARTGEVCRIGGDEFCVILTGAAMPSVEPVAAGIVASLREPIDWQGKTCRIGASIGIAKGGGDTGVTEPERLLTDADLATYTAKAEGRGRFAHFDAALREEMEREAVMVEALGEGLKAGRLEIWFQPVTTLDAERVISAEVLIRWRDPRLGEVSPEQLMRIAEGHSMLDQVHGEILRLLCDTLATWARAGTALPLITLNLSPLELRFPTLIEGLGERLAGAGIDPAGLGLEVTEAALGGRGGELVRTALEEARARGFTVIVDRFGRDDCALSTIGAMGAQLAKIDRGLVAQLGRDADGATLLRGLVSLANSLSLSVVATGVETREQLDLLQDVGCEGLQGFAVARPMPAESFAHWLAFAEIAPLPSAVMAPGALRARSA